MEYCPRCMRPLTTPFCSHCGGGANEQNGAGMLPVGTRLTGSSGTRTYQVGMALGMGGFGVTYIALELETGNRVAMKEFFPCQCGWARRGADGVTVEAMPGKDNDYNRGRISFLKEARVLASMKGSHPAVVTGLDYVEMHNTAYLVMEYLDGTPLYKVVRQRGHLSPEELLPKIDRLMDGIIWLHRKGIIHRDICPDNIMWKEDGSLKLMDFGSARLAEGNSQLTVHFKPGFAPVEQYTSSGQGTWTDVYTLAATIYYCLTGQNPVSSSDRLMRRATDGVDPLRPPDNIDPQQCAALMHALGISKEERSETMAQFREELFPPPAPSAPDAASPFTAPSAPVTRPSVPLTGPSAADWIRSHLIAVVSGVVALLVLILIVILLTGNASAADAASEGLAYEIADSTGLKCPRSNLAVEQTADLAYNTAGL